jgi:hypothetical protein
MRNFMNPNPSVIPDKIINLHLNLSPGKALVIRTITLSSFECSEKYINFLLAHTFMDALKT